MEFSRQDYQRGLPFPSPGDFPYPGIEPGSPSLQTDSLPTEPPGKPKNIGHLFLFLCLSHKFCLKISNFKCLAEGSGGFPGGLDSKESACNVGNLGLIPGLGRCPGGGCGNLLQYSCLGNSHGQRSLGGYMFIGSQRVRHDWMTKHSSESSGY